ncbi:DUF1496 domain-containing protein [Stakelama marina]|uniref:Uncharacterized protein n=1 Tax=Stakelama marina TaxID=2826939 RepID=A0A8T4IH57_9SPHN|nr:DUF1496 domain-containing protein [Stakelama marina]MBR0552405.1 hypothetical protein [Stakelama marina]
MQTEDVAPQDPALKNSDKAAQKDEGVAKAAMSGAICYWNDKKYSDGATVCDNKRRYECWNGKWVDIGDC